MNKKESRIRRSKKTRLRIAAASTNRLVVFRSNSHIYAQIIDASGAKVLAHASTVDKELAANIAKTGNIDAAKVVGKAIADRAKASGVANVAFDRSGFSFHGRVKALAESARENGLIF